MHASDEHSFLDIPTREGKPRERGLTHVMDKGLNLREIEGLFDTAGEYVDIVKLGWGTSYVTNNLEKKIALYRSFSTPVVCGGTLFEAVYGQAKDGRVQALARALPLLARRDLGRHARDSARGEARADRRLLPRLRRPLRGRLEGLRRQHRAVPLGAVDPRGARCRLVEGHRRGSRGRHRRHLPPDRRAAHRASSTRSSTRSPSTTSSGRRRRSPRRPGSYGTSVPRSTWGTSRPTRSSRSRRFVSGSEPTR